jgi:hypothetical protein
MVKERWYERAAWIWFAGLCASVVPIGLLAYVNPAAAADTWARFGHEMPAAVAADPAATRYVEFISHWSATSTLGLNLFGLLIAVTAFRAGARWAWLAMWFFPFMFLTHFFTYTSNFRYAQLVWIVLSVVALLATYRKVWRRPRVVPDAGREAVPA